MHAKNVSRIKCILKEVKNTKILLYNKIVDRNVNSNVCRENIKQMSYN